MTVVCSLQRIPRTQKCCLFLWGGWNELDELCESAGQDCVCASLLVSNDTAEKTWLLLVSAYCFHLPFWMGFFFSAFAQRWLTVDQCVLISSLTSTSLVYYLMSCSVSVPYSSNLTYSIWDSLQINSSLCHLSLLFFPLSSCRLSLTSILSLILTLLVWQKLNLCCQSYYYNNMTSSNETIL